MSSRITVFPGAVHLPGYLDRPSQEKLADILRQALGDAPLFQPRMPRTGKPFSVRMSNLGPLGWVSDETGYRYQAAHPDTGRPWPALPELLLKAWKELSGYPHPPQACLVNWYEPGARMGLHQDRDEEDFAAPVLSLSLGDSAVFRIGGTDRRSATRSVRLESGDVFILGGEARLAFHGIDRVIAGSSSLLPAPGRINLTLRRVTRPKEVSS
ncbi:alpha-ketoglutarate-dependent dioxygenase AlkB [Terrihabitans sp. B22-R8]|uniref:alpha-ketoglutarate-dependent dioxygenase AlkB n=1 Tax=Terrihabitans sp. B22-R8 TaxID=3425128 RepID=UPI00403D520F